MEVNKIYNVDCFLGLKEIADSSIDCCITSPPYYGLREYKHAAQIGLESTPGEYIENLVKVFSEVMRVLKDSGTFWLNIGDSYYNYRPGWNGALNKQSFHRYENGKPVDKTKGIGRRGNKLLGYKEKDLIGIPWQVALSLRANGWYLRQDIIWSKPNPTPESVRDRFTKSHEYLFLFSKQQNYYFNTAFAIEDSITGGTRKKRSVWSVPVNKLKDAHFATFPENLIIDCVKTGCPENGVILDPFMGAGTTALVSSKLGRNYIGFEINKDFIQIAEKRLNMEYSKANL